MKRPIKAVQGPRHAVEVSAADVRRSVPWPVLCSLAGLLLPVSVLAQSVIAAAEPQPVNHRGPWGVQIQTRLDSEYGYNSNVTAQRDPALAIGSNYYGLTPSLRVSGQRGQDRYALLYQGAYREYTASSADSYYDQRWALNTRWRYGLRHALALNASLDKSHESRGEELTEGFSQRQLEGFGVTREMPFTLDDTELRYSYGAPEARGKLEVALQQKNKRYQALSSYTPDFAEYVDEKNWRENTLITELFDQVSHESRFRYTLQTNQRHYRASPQNDTNDYFAWFGVRSQLTGKTKADVNIGWLHKTFAAGESRTFDGLNWDVRVDWMPVNRSQFSVVTWQRAVDPDSSGVYVNQRRYALGWLYNVTPSLAVLTDYRFTREKYQGKQRSDSFRDFSLGIEYRLRPSVLLSMNYLRSSHSTTNPTDPLFIGNRFVERDIGYDRNAAALAVKIAF